ERLRQVLPRPELERLDARLDARIARHDDGDGVRLRRQSRLEQLEPRDLRHVEVDQDDVERLAPQELQRLFAPRRRRDVVALGLQDGGAALAQRALVIHDEDLDTGPLLPVERDRRRDALLRAETGATASRAESVLRHAALTSS